MVLKSERREIEKKGVSKFKQTYKLLEIFSLKRGKNSRDLKNTCVRKL